MVFRLLEIESRTDFLRDPILFSDSIRMVPAFAPAFNIGAHSCGRYAKLVELVRQKLQVSSVDV